MLSILPINLAAEMVELKERLYDADSPSRYIFPAEFKSYQKYHKNWLRLTDLELSEIHWNQSVIFYTNTEKSKTVFYHNHIGFKKVEREEIDWQDFAFVSYPIGTVILKEHYTVAYNASATPTFITLMIKREKNYDALASDWQYVQFDTSGKILVNGHSRAKDVEECVECHQSVRSQDYVYASYYRFPLTLDEDGELVVE